MHDRSSRSTPFSLHARLVSFGHAWRGLLRMVHCEHNARVHLVASISVVAVGLLLKLSAGDWGWLLFAMALVWLAEAFNTAIEELCDRIEPGFDEAIGRIKDVTAGAVLVASGAGAGIGFLTFGPPILAFWK